MKKVKGLILVHPSKHSIAFDIFGDENTIKKYFLRSEYDIGYVVEGCSFVKAINRKDYVCSEDLEHTESVNLQVMEAILKLVKEGFEFTVMEK